MDQKKESQGTCTINAQHACCDYVMSGGYGIASASSGNIDLHSRLTRFLMQPSEICVKIDTITLSGRDDDTEYGQAVAQYTSSP